MTDTALYDSMNRLKSGDASALEYIYDRYSAAILGIIQKMVTDTQAAEDLLQEVFIKIWQKAGQYDSGRATPFTWMMNIARNHAIDHLRSRRFNEERKTKTGDDFVHLNETAESLSLPTDGIGLSGKLRELPEDQRRIVYLAYYQGYTQEEMARTLNIPLGTVKSRLRLAMNSLRKLLTMLIPWI